MYRDNDDQGGDLLIDIVSHIPVTSVHSQRDESAGRYDDSTS
jgi:hypothetical protein